MQEEEVKGKLLRQTDNNSQEHKRRYEHGDKTASALKVRTAT